MSIPEGAPARAWIGLGGNVGDVRRSMRQAVAGIGALPGTRVEAASSLYRTKPWGDADQDDFLNACFSTLFNHELHDWLVSKR